MSEMEPGQRAHAAYCRATGMDAYTTEKDWALYEGTHAAWASVEAALAQPPEPDGDFPEDWDTFSPTVQKSMARFWRKLAARRRDEILREAALAQAEWQDISTAPKDGTVILISNGNDVEMSFWTYVDWPKWPWAINGGTDALAEDWPTHWRPRPPLPSPPEPQP